MRQIVLVLVIIITIGFLSCEYTPSETNFYNVERPSANVNLIILDSNQVNSLRGMAKISFQSVLDGHQYKRSEIYVDGKRVGYGTESNGYFTLNTTDYPDGMHKVKYVLYVKTNSGSLADILYAEAFVVQKEYDVLFYNGTVLRPQIQYITDTIGTVKIVWTKYAQQAFHKYVVQRDGQVIAVIQDVNCTYWLDSSYVGGYTQYEVGLYVGGEGIFSTIQSFSASMPTLSGAIVGDDSAQIKLTWTRCKYDSGFYAYKIYGHDGTSIYHVSVIAEIHDINLTSYIDSSSLFGHSKYQIGLISKTYQSPLELSNSFVSSPGKKVSEIMKGSHFEYVDSTNRFYMISGRYPTSTLKVYDGTTFQVIAMNQMSLNTYLRFQETGCDISMNGKWCYAMVDDMPSKLYQLDPQTLSFIGNSITLDDLYPFQSVYSISVSDNNRLIALGQPEAQLALIDMNTHKLLAKSRIGGYEDVRANNLQISRRGEYFLNKTSLFRYINDTIIKIADVPSTSKFMREPNKLVRQVGTIIQIVLLPSLSVEREISIGTGQTFLDYDPKTGYINCTGSNTGFYKFYDLSTGRLVKTIPVYTESSVYKFQGGVLFTNNSYLKIQF